MSAEAKPPRRSQAGAALRRSAVVVGGVALGALVGGTAGAFGIGGAAAFLAFERRHGAPPHRGPATEHFDGRRFRNLEPTKRNGFVSVTRWMLSRDRGPWLRAPAGPPGPPPPASLARGDLRATFIGHATVLLQLDGLTLLLDPVWSNRVGPYSWLGSKRAHPPGIRFEDLPRIDAVLVSHNHYDHLDLPTLRRLTQDHRPRFLVPLGNKALLDARGVTGGEDLDWWQSVELPGGVRITAVPARHWSGRATTDRQRALWCGFVVEGAGGVIYYAGDTADGLHFAQVAERWPRITLAILPIGAYRPQWFMQKSHLSPEEAVRAHQMLGAKQSLAVHFGTFPLADDGETEAVEALQDALTRAGVPREQFWVLGFGEGRNVPRP